MLSSGGSEQIDKKHVLSLRLWNSMPSVLGANLWEEFRHDLTIPNDCALFARSRIEVTVAAELNVLPV